MVATIPELFLELFKDMGIIIVISFLITRTPFFSGTIKKDIAIRNQIVLAIFFGLTSILGTYTGVAYLGAIANIRDLVVMIAGLLSGPFVGLGAGLIGGLQRYSIGGFTAIPCMLGTVLSGVIGGVISYRRKSRPMFIGFAAAFAALMEGFNMLLILLISRPFESALATVQGIALPMIIVDAIGMLLFAYILSSTNK